MLKLVPFNEAWVSHDKLDVHAIYRRPQRHEDEYGEIVQTRGPSGEPLWDLTSPLPVRQHNRWRAKGYEYVTLANAPGIEPGGGLKYVRDAARAGTLAGGSVQDYSQDPRTGGPWNLRKYLESQGAADLAAVASLKDQIAKYGWEAVEDMRRSTDPNFRVAEALKVNQAAQDEPVGVGKSRKGAVN
jgi:hypothetical protein